MFPLFFSITMVIIVNMFTIENNYYHYEIYNLKEKFLKGLILMYSHLIKLAIQYSYVSLSMLLKEQVFDFVEFGKRKRR